MSTMGIQGIGPISTSRPPSTPLVTNANKTPTSVHRQGIGPLQVRHTDVARSDLRRTEPPSSPPTQQPTHSHAVIRPEPQGTRPHRDPSGWVQQHVVPTRSPADPRASAPRNEEPLTDHHSPIPAAYRVFEEFLEEGRRAAELWARPAAFERPPQGLNVQNLGGTALQLMRAFTQTLEQMNGWLRLLPGATSTPSNTSSDRPSSSPSDPRVPPAISSPGAGAPPPPAREPPPSFGDDSSAPDASYRPTAHDEDDGYIRQPIKRESFL